MAQVPVPNLDDELIANDARLTTSEALAVAEQIRAQIASGAPEAAELIREDRDDDYGNRY